LAVKFSKYLSTFGFLRGIYLIFRLRLLPGNDLIQVSIPKYKHPFVIRGNTTDVYIFEKVLLLEDYHVPYFDNFSPKFIIDGGAYVGYSSLFFANKFPDALVVAVEPEESNFAILEKNTTGYDNIKRIKAGIWNKNTFLKIVDLSVGHYGFMVKEVVTNESGSLKAVTIGEILKGCNFEKIDILKLDTEGAEKEIFSSSFQDWLGKTKIIIIELHDFNREGCTTTFYSAIKNYHFTEIHRDEENRFFLRDG